MKNQLPHFFLLTCVFLLFIGCASMQTRWNNAKTEDTIEGYQKFLKKYPESDFAEDANQRIENLRFEEALQKDEIVYYENFMKDYPESKFFDQARNKLHDKVIYLKSLRTKVIQVIDEDYDDMSAAISSSVRSSLVEYGYEVVSISDTSFDATLRIGPIVRGLPPGIYFFKISADLKEARPHSYAYCVRMSLYHKHAGSVFDEEIWSDFVSANTPGQWIAEMMISLDERITYDSWIESTNGKKEGQESLIENVRKNIKEYFKEYFGLNI